MSAYLVHRELHHRNSQPGSATREHHQGALPPPGLSCWVLSYLHLWEPLTSFPVLLPRQILPSTEVWRLHSVPVSSISSVSFTYAMVLLLIYITNFNTLLSGPLPALQETLYHVVTGLKKKSLSYMNIMHFK